MANQILGAGVVGIRQPEPPEGRKAFPLQPNLNFAADTDTFSWSSQSLGNAQPTGIQSIWVDATELVPTTGNLIINVNGTQKIVVQAGTQGYVIITSQMPLTLNFSVSTGVTGNVQIILYNYNALFTGGTTQSGSSGGAPVASGSGGGTGGVSGGSGGSSPSSGGRPFGPGRPVGA